MECRSGTSDLRSCKNKSAGRIPCPALSLLVERRFTAGTAEWKQSKQVRKQHSTCECKRMLINRRNKINTGTVGESVRRLARRSCFQLWRKSENFHHHNPHETQTLHTDARSSVPLCCCMAERREQTATASRVLSRNILPRNPIVNITLNRLWQLSPASGA